MKARTLVATLAVVSLFVGATSSVADAQVPEGTTYALHSAAAGGCPALDWHVVSGPGGTLEGMISWNGMKSMAHASGKMGADKTFTMHAKEVGGAARTATITGQARSDGWLVADVKGKSIDCKGIVVPIWRASGGTQQ